MFDLYASPLGYSEISHLLFYAVHVIVWSLEEVCNYGYYLIGTSLSKPHNGQKFHWMVIKLSYFICSCVPQ